MHHPPPLNLTSNTRGLPATTHRPASTAMEDTVPGRAARYTLGAKPRLGLGAEIRGRGTGGDDASVAGVLAIVAEEAKRTLEQFDAIDMVEHDVGIKSFGMTAHAVHESRPLEGLDVPGPIVHIGGGHELAALLQAGDQQGMAVGSRRISCGGVPCGTRPQDEEWTVPVDAHV